jgi:hypothetical protein
MRATGRQRGCDGLGTQHALLTAAWLSLMRAALRKPASQPTSAPHGNTSLGSACGVPLSMARAP